MTTTYPDTYLHVRDEQSGEEWISPIGDNDSIDLQTQVDAWIANQFCGECTLDGEIMPRVSGAYYARIMTDGRSPDSVVCWDGGGFYLKSTYQD